MSKKEEKQVSDLDEVVQTVLKLHSAFMGAHARELEELRSRIEALEDRAVFNTVMSTTTVVPLTD